MEVCAALLESAGRECVRGLMASANSEVIPAVAMVTSETYFLTTRLISTMVNLRSTCVNHSFYFFIVWCSKKKKKNLNISQKE